MSKATAILFETDAYKLDHRRQYQLAGDVTRVYSNYTNRKSRIKGVDRVVHFGLQAFLKHLQKGFDDFFNADIDKAANEYEWRLARILGLDAAKAIGTDHIRALHTLGYIPLEFRAVPEGTLVPIRIPSLTVENTVDEFFWLTNYIETSLSNHLWLPSTTATIAHAYRRILDAAAGRTGGDSVGVDFQLHDFSYRGMGGLDAAKASAAGHLLSFVGSDSLCALDWIEENYGDSVIDLFSVAATEHSVMGTGILSDNRTNAEERLFGKLLDLYPGGILSVVSDTFDLWAVLRTYLPNLHKKIMQRDGKLVIRPDSGDPVKILTGNPAGRTIDEQRGVVELLWEAFGGTVNDKGYRVLDSHVGAIYGDSITLERAQEITDRLESMGFASTNVVFGVGSYSYQYQTRDTFGSAVKATWVRVDSKGVNVFKDPITDDGTKRSATGRLAVLGGGNEEFYLVENANAEAEEQSALQPVWRDGQFLRHQSFSDVRAVLAKGRAA